MPHITEIKEVCSVKYYATGNNDIMLEYLELALDCFSDANVEIFWNKIRSI